MQAGHQLGEQGFVGAAVAEILGYRLDQRLALVTEHVAQGVEPLDALLGRRHGVSFECLPLNGKAALQLTDLLLTVLQALFEVSDVGDHDAAPWQSSIAGIKGLMLLEMAMLDF